MWNENAKIFAQVIGKRENNSRQLLVYLSKIFLLKRLIRIVFFVYLNKSEINTLKHENVFELHQSCQVKHKMRSTRVTINISNIKKESAWICLNINWKIHNRRLTKIPKIVISVFSCQTRYLNKHSKIEICWYNAKQSEIGLHAKFGQI